MSCLSESFLKEFLKNRQIRQSHLVKAEIESDRFGRFDMTIRNLSQTGIGGRAENPLNRGETVTVFLPGHRSMAATVRWSDGLSFGIETEREIQIEKLRDALASHASSSGGPSEFRIVAPSKVRFKRPGLRLGITLPPSTGFSRW